MVSTTSLTGLKYNGRPGNAKTMFQQREFPSASEIILLALHLIVGKIFHYFTMYEGWQCQEQGLRRK